MISRFALSFLISFILTMLTLAGVGYAIANLGVRESRDPFRTSSYEFDLVDGWWCEYEETELVCTPSGKPPFSAIAIMASKERNEKDNLQAYEEHLRKPKSNGPEDKASKIEFVKRRTLADREWVEALHHGSELPNYQTYYLATSTSHLGILVTMSVHKDHKEKYIGQLNQMMKTLIVYQR